MNAPLRPPGATLNGLSIAALLLSLMPITAPLAIYLASVAKRQIAATGEGGRDLARAATVIGWAMTVLLGLAVGLAVLRLAVAGLVN